MNKSLVSVIASVCFGICSFDVGAVQLIGRSYDSVGYAVSFAEMGFDSGRVQKYLALKLTPNEVSKFRDTEKPNALVVFPWADYDSFFIKDTMYSLFQKVRRRYDTKVVIASEEDDVYNAIKSTPNIELLILSGHAGNGGRHICLGVSGDDAICCDKDYHENLLIDSGDAEFGKYLDMLSSHAVILVYSCYSANRPEAIANFIVSVSKRKKVIAPINNLHYCGLKIKTLYPFDVRFINYESGKDCTFTSEKKHLTTNK